MKVLKAKHIDLCALIHEKERRRVSLHQLAELNLGEPKHTQGRSMANLDIEALKIACRSDVWQTYRLWQMWRKGDLKIPEPRNDLRRSGKTGSSLAPATTCRTFARLVMPRTRSF